MTWPLSLVTLHDWLKFDPSSELGSRMTALSLSGPPLGTVRSGPASATITPPKSTLLTNWPLPRVNVVGPPAVTLTSSTNQPSATPVASELNRNCTCPCLPMNCDRSRFRGTNPVVLLGSPPSRRLSAIGVNTPSAKKPTVAASGNWLVMTTSSMYQPSP